ncbi:hypothetical protein [Peribacillus muralis]|uniref:hypothetical protein n=1 Tax=Peribacillus muralis TaxID=264697 RepID=UPI00071009F0|nr:hypothetical protein [Peribacillus muralis]
MKQKVLQSLFVLILGFSIITPPAFPTKTAEACYPAYQCMSKTVLPTSYKLYFSNKDRSVGVFIGSIAIGASAFIPGMSVPSFLSGGAFGIKELTKGYMSYKVYIKRHPASNKKGQLKIVYYKDKNYKGSSKTSYRDF